MLPAPTVYVEYMRQAAISPLMLSNFLFFTRQGYFDLQADEKPFLHTWTLSIEEQFYLLAPILLDDCCFVWKEELRLARCRDCDCAGCLARLPARSPSRSSIGRNPAFYFPHWRAWEFIAGGLIGRELASAC